MAKRKHNRKTYQKTGKGGRIFFVVKILVFSFLLFLTGVVFLFLYYIKDLPRPEKFDEKEMAQSTKIFDRTGNVLLYEIYGEEKRTWVSLEKIPDHLKKAVLVAEDKNFYRHPGVDLKAIIRAISVDLKLGKVIQGGSTIPQQLIRSSFLSREKTFSRKTREIILTLELSRRYTKDQILEWYLNQIPFGSNAYGVEAASQTFFRKPVSEISLAEAATLVALIQAPSYLSPYGENKENLLARKNYILDKMAEEGYSNKERADEAKKEEIKFSEVLRPIKAPHFVMYVRDYLVKRYGEETLKRKGFRVYTTLDWDLQKLAEMAVKEGSERNYKYGVYNSALAALSPKTGEILSLVGSADWYATSSKPNGCQSQKNCLFEPKFDIATLGKRQPGSAFKPFVYATAFKKGSSDKTVVIDEETNFGSPAHPYVPQNYDGLFRGPVTLRQALAQSLNVPSVKVLADLAGIEDSIKTAKDLGITTLTKPPSFYGLPLVLGGGEVNLLEMTSAYGVFATQGLRSPPVFILKIIDPEGNVIEENEKIPQRVLNTEIARLISDILSDNEARAPMFGQRSPLYFDNYQVAVKTGTTQDYKDAWTIGYTPLIVVGVWVGNNDNSPPKAKKPGVYSAGQIWRKFMDDALLIIKER
ncbi:MAG: penicillin-binding protein [Candidatus Nealsonbacteria bacterium CG08_land_8_20_14_0_20_38_20]|uniref:Penicillin-binding protein n=1 Tax=Candidatus Nealsonbacteria bacterium CG08_land_8_20_14_0_20_38_20 TaxID=1974705 RepID=A0A2H0YLB5_9BACT|nr:MAG: penicillin-binding protein [Candidatus Nealsonbacteria bacterium CG08_land_8_20_14_0_20_38_20]